MIFLCARRLKSMRTQAKVTLLLQVEMFTDAYAAAKGSHALCVLTEWDEFKQLDYEKIYNEMVRPSPASGLHP